MPTISGENLVPLGHGGAAYVLGKSTPDALAVLMQGQRAKQAAEYRAALAKQKQAEVIGKQFDEDRKINYDAGGLFQQSFNDYAAPLPDKLAGIYQQESKGTITRMERDRLVANEKGAAERERLLSIDRNKDMDGYMVKQGSNPYRDTTELNTALGHSVLIDDPATGGTRRVRASEYDPMKVKSEFDNNPLTYAPDPVLRDFATKQASDTIDEASAGRIGGTHSSSSLTYKGMVPVKRADGTWDVMRDGNHRPVVSMSAADLESERRTNHPLNMAITRLEGEEDKVAKAQGRAPLSALDLYQRDSRKYFSFKQADAVGRNAQPATGRAAGKGDAVVTPFDERQVTPVMEGATIKGTPSPFEQALGLSQYTTKQAGFFTSRHAGAPTTEKKGVKKVMDASNIRSKIVYQPDENGNYVFNDNNDKPITGKHGVPYELPTDPTTGHFVPPKDAADEARLKKLYPSQTWIGYPTDNNKNFTQQSEEHLRQALGANPEEGEAGHKTYQQMKDEAEKAVSKGVSIQYVPYNKNTSGTIRNQVGPYYDDFHKGTVRSRQAAQQAPAPKPANSTGGAYTPKVKTAPTAKSGKGKPTTSNTGGLY